MNKKKTLNYLALHKDNYHGCMLDDFAYDDVKLSLINHGRINRHNVTLDIISSVFSHGSYDNHRLQTMSYLKSRGLSLTNTSRKKNKGDTIDELNYRTEGLFPWRKDNLFYLNSIYEFSDLLHSPNIKKRILKILKQIKEK